MCVCVWVQQAAAAAAAASLLQFCCCCCGCSRLNPKLITARPTQKKLVLLLLCAVFPSSNRVRVACSNSVQCCYNTVIERTTEYKSVVHHSKQQMEPPLSSCIHFVHTHFGYAGPVVVVVRSINGHCNLFVPPRAFVPGTERRRRRLVFACFVYALAGSAYTCMIQFHSVFYDARIVTDAQSRTLF